MLPHSIHSIRRRLYPSAGSVGAGVTVGTASAPTGRRLNRPDLSWQDVRNDWHKVPNLVTGLRLLLTIPVCWWALAPGWKGYTTFGLFVFAAATDKVDGWLAKRNNGALVTKTGKVLDPYVDKILVLATLLTVWIRADATGISRVELGTALVIVALRELIVALVRLVQTIESASESGRISMVLQSAAVAALLFPVTWEWQPAAGRALLFVGVGASVCSGWTYVARWLNPHTSELAAAGQACILLCLVLGISVTIAPPGPTPIGALAPGFWVLAGATVCLSWVVVTTSRGHAAPR